MKKLFRIGEIKLRYCEMLCIFDLIYFENIKKFDLAHYIQTKV